jgi:diguanylate cyclase (GGDEF)-like protein
MMLGKPRVLVVDDQPENIHALSAILADDATVLFALSGEQALARVGEGNVDLVLLDVMLPGMNGFEVCTRMKAGPESAEIPVIFVTALSDHTDEEHGFRVGAVDFVHKPFMPTIVRARVRTHLKLRSLLKQASELAGTDPLTGIGNRRLFESRVEAEIAAIARHGHSACLAMVDVDHFKGVNDEFGHVRGDDVLREVAARGLACVRAADVWSRWGGEEFAWLMPGSSLSEGRQAAERLREHIQRENFKGVGRVTISIGLSTFQPGENLPTWVQRADAALYRAKAAGRNRVELAT